MDGLCGGDRVLQGNEGPKRDHRRLMTRSAPLQTVTGGVRAIYRRVYRAHGYVKDDPKPKRIQGVEIK